MPTQIKNKVYLIVHDGWGIATEPELEGNATEAGTTTNMDKIGAMQPPSPFYFFGARLPFGHHLRLFGFNTPPPRPLPLPVLPPHIVGHTGSLPAAAAAISATAVGTVYAACQAAGYVLLITVDHGNAEQMSFPKPEEMTGRSLLVKAPQKKKVGEK
ncbi:hypothetical protein B0H14DRAFT_3883396 [Mycena olivaceomarginata]|nr:hypothetical protein B0H14DRAFT_3883396 [Mycena olivaceomarginata]